MLNIQGFGRLVKVLVPYRKETRTGQNGSFEAEDIMVSVAFDRAYKVTGKDGNKEKATDFIPVKATGAVAKALQDYYVANKDENGNPISRPIYVAGKLETYPRKRAYKAVHEVELAGKVHKVEIEDELNETGYIIVADNIEFTSGNPAKASGTVTTKKVARVVDDETATDATPATDADGNECPI